MADDLIKRRDLYLRLVNVTAKDWIKAVKKLGFYLTQPSGGSSHYAIRDPRYPEDDFKNNYLTNIYEGMNGRRDVNPKVFKCIRKQGVEEDDIWRALGML